MLDAYLDESGVHGGAVACVIAGYYGGRGEWRRFEKGWRKAFADHGVPLAQFHALHLVKRRRYFSAAEGWDQERYSSFVAALASAITAHKICPVSVSIVVDDFMSFTEMQRRFFTGATMLNGRLITTGCPNKAYFTPFQNCVKRVASYAPVGGKANFYFGLDRPFGGYAKVLYEMIKTTPRSDGYRDRLGETSFPLAKDTPQLQAADLLAYLTFDHMNRLLESNQENAPPSDLLNACLVRTRVSEDHSYMNRSMLQQSLEQTYQREGRWDGTEVPQIDHEEEDELPTG
jgi:hypothetical protein